MEDSNYYFGDKEKGTQFFVSQLSQGHKWAKYIASKLGDQGIDCFVDEMKVAETVSERRNFHNEKDVVFTKMSGCLEVKSQSCIFTSDPASWPYKKTIVDTALGWSRKSPRPLATVLVSIHTGEALVVPASTEGKWVREKKYDRYRKIHDTFLMADPSLLKPFSELVEWLKARQDKFNTNIGE